MSEKLKPGYFHYCPCCGEEYKCPCNSCNNKSMHEFLPSGEEVRCKACGFTASFDEMQDIEIMQYEWQDGIIAKQEREDG